MIEILNQRLDPSIVSLQDIENQLAFLSSSHYPKKVTFLWLDTQLTQEELLNLYLPIVEKMVKKDIEIHCLMSVFEAKRLVRYPRLMFIDPLFLYKFRFKSIRFQLPDVKELNT